MCIYTHVDWKSLNIHRKLVCCEPNGTETQSEHFVSIYGIDDLLQMPDCWLEVSNRKVLRPATSAQVFLGFPVSKANLELVPKIPSCHYMLLM
jgi:hypothetical protein